MSNKIEGILAGLANPDHFHVAKPLAIHQLVIDAASFIFGNAVHKQGAIAEVGGSILAQFRFDGFEYSRFKAHLFLLFILIYNFIILNDQVNIYTAPTSVQSLNYLYTSKEVIRAQDGSPLDSWLADDNYSVLNEYAIELQGTWIYLKQLGRPYDEEKLKADTYLENVIAQDGSRKVVRVNMTEIRPYQGNIAWLEVPPINV